MKMRDIQVLKDVFAVEQERYSAGGANYSATEIIDPPRLVALKKRYKEQIRNDIETGVDSLMGTAMHALFEKCLTAYQAIDPHYDLERRMFLDIELDGGVKRKLSGQYDILYRQEILTDVKTAKVWKKVFDPDLIHWTQQQNIYAYLCKQVLQLDVSEINALIIYKDWAKNSALRDRSYPQEPIELRQLNLWSSAEQEAFVKQRIALHVATDDVDDKELPICTSEERWERFPDGSAIKFAFFKKKAKRATKVLHGCKTLAEAVGIAQGIKGVSANSFLEIRYSERKRCENYCPVSDFCNVHVAYKRKKANNTLNEIYPLKGVV